MPSEAYKGQWAVGAISMLGKRALKSAGELKGAQW